MKHVAVETSSVKRSGTDGTSRGKFPFRVNKHFRAGVLLPAVLALYVISLSQLQAQTVQVAASIVWKPYLQQVTDTGVIVLWTTQAGSDNTVRYATDTSYASSATGTLRTLNTLGTRLNRVQLSGLQPNTQYYYKVYTDNTDLLPDQVLTFRTAPAKGTPAPFTFLAFGDYGVGSTSQKLLRDQMQRDSFQFLVTTGDNAYGEGTYEQFDRNVFQIYGDLFSRAAVFPAIGNHEYLTKEGMPYLDLFDLPGNALRADDRERYYAFDYGNARIAVLDVAGQIKENDSAATDDMFDWLRNDLSSTTQQWKIVVLHHSPYSTGSHAQDAEVGLVQTKLVPIFEQYNVDLVLGGHDHVYQRTYPLRAGSRTTVAAGGIVYVTSGAGDAASYGCDPASRLAVSYCSQSYGMYNRITVNDKVITIEAIRETGEVKDYYVLTQSDGSPQPPLLNPADRKWLPVIRKP